MAVMKVYVRNITSACRTQLEQDRLESVITVCVPLFGGEEDDTCLFDPESKSYKLSRCGTTTVGFQGYDIISTPSAKFIAITFAFLATNP